jgi:hypothetical protein
MNPRMLRATRLLAMCQAADLTGAGLLAEPAQHGYGRVRGQGPRVSEDRRPAPGICRLAAEIRSGSLQAAWRIPESVRGHQPGRTSAMRGRLTGGDTAAPVSLWRSRDRGRLPGGSGEPCDCLDNRAGCAGEVHAGVSRAL